MTDWLIDCLKRKGEEKDRKEGGREGRERKRRRRDNGRKEWRERSIVNVGRET